MDPVPAHDEAQRTFISEHPLGLAIIATGSWLRAGSKLGSGSWTRSIVVAYHDAGGQPAYGIVTVWTKDGQPAVELYSGHARWDDVYQRGMKACRGKVDHNGYRRQEQDCGDGTVSWGNPTRQAVKVGAQRWRERHTPARRAAAADEQGVLALLSEARAAGTTPAALVLG